MVPLCDVLNHHAFIDLETTGLDPSCDEVIEVGVVFVERGEIVSRLSQLCRPSMPLPLVIRRLTGLDDQVLTARAPFRDFAAELTAALRGWTLVAHNASFERGFLAALIDDLDAPLLDSCELLHYLHPELPSHALEQVVRWAGVGQTTAHRALHDSEDTLAVVEYALRRCLDEGRQDDVADLLKLLAPPPAVQLSFDEPTSPMVSLLQRLLAQLKKRPGRLALTESAPFLPQRAEWSRAPDAPQPADVDAVLAEGGAMELLGEGFEARPAQLELAHAVARTLQAGGTLAVEAATGTGKSLGYLAPAALYARVAGARVAIAPHTRALQDQLVDKDLPRLHRATHGAFGFAVLKGQGNYACRRRALELTAPGPELTWDQRASRAYLRAWLRRSPDGDLDRISYWFKDRFAALEPLVAMCRSEAATTLGPSCPHHARCFYHSAVARAKAADVLVINQSLALRWPARYPPIDHLIIDEAHELEDAATSAFSDELSESSMGALVERLAGRWGLATALRHEVSAALASELTKATSTLAADARTLGDALRAVPESAERLPFDQRVTAEVRTTRSWLRVRDALHGTGAALLEVERVLTAELAEAAPTLSAQWPAIDRQVAGALEAVREVSRLIESIADRPDGARCHELSVRERGWALASRPIEVAELFQREVLQIRRSVVLTSATLSIGPDSPWVLERLGLTAGEHRTPLLRLGGGFDLRGQALVMLVTDAPDVQTDAFTDWATSRISGLAQFLSGRVLGLFASTRRLEQVGERVRAALEPLGIEVLRQSRGSPRMLAARQEQDLGTVLLGTRSFWQGLDIPGLGVACVFIDKLPIEPGSRPIVEAREEKLGADPSGFLNYRLPRALLQLRQGVGRLIRSPHDRGVVVIADPGSQTYRARLYDALEGYRVEALPWHQARQRLYQTLKRLGLGAPRVARPVQTASPGPEQWSLFD